MTRRWLLILPLLAFGGLLGLLGWGLAPNRDPTVLPSVMVGRAVPDFSLPALGGEESVSPRKLAGRLYLINFFASWCVPCRAEHALLRDFAALHHIPVLGILYKDDTDKARVYLSELGNFYTAIGRDDQGRTAIDFGVTGVPETYVVDGTGTILFRQAGPLDAGSLDHQLLPLIEARR
ncbi:MAG TPA: DsbE family thiol:disulfide interchange protein [Dongiaceae bacterium]|nr:DsbE family thiol:disulfide interchange protein [Dongiaceae bacterium]